MNRISNFYLFAIVPFAAAVPFLASLTIFLRPAKERYLKYFSIFLFVNFLLEASTSYTAWNNIHNTFLNNLDSVLVLCFDLFLIREIVASPKAKRLFLYFILAYPLLSLVNIFLVQTSGVFHTMTYSFGCLLVVSACIYYFWELFQQRNSVDLVSQPAFWICSGLLFYYACSFPLFGLTKFLQALPKVILQNLFSILILLTVFLYLSFTIAYLCRLKTKKFT
jgi:hypothetical protein